MSYLVHWMIIKKEKSPIKGDFLIKQQKTNVLKTIDFFSQIIYNTKKVLNEEIYTNFEHSEYKIRLM